MSLVGIRGDPTKRGPKTPDSGEETHASSAHHGYQDFEDSIEE